MANIRKLLKQITEEENQLTSSQFLAPCVSGGKIKTRVAGIIYTFTPEPIDFAGWGIFQPENEKTARLVEEADLPQIGAYLHKLLALRLRLAHKLHRNTWLAYPINEGDMKQRCGKIQPISVHLVSDGARFEQVIARTDGITWWFDEIDRRADPMITAQLNNYFQQLTPPENLQFSGITPEMRTVYSLAGQQAQEFMTWQQQRKDEARLQQALQMGGGELQTYRDRPDSWLVEWTTCDGTQHTSEILKSDLTVVSAGICLSGEDEKFDLQSLVGVVEGSDEY